MDVFQIFAILLVCLLSWLIVKFITKVFIKIVLVILILTISFVSYFHFTKKNIFDTMNELYCADNNSNELKCKCFVLNINKDLEESFSKSKVDSIKNNTLKSMTYFIKSYENKKDKIKVCFEENGVAGGIVEEIKVDLIKKTSNFFDFKD